MGKLNCGNWMIRACGIFLLWGATAIALPAQTFTTLHSFDRTDGANPKARLVQATNGDFYGTTENGGAYNPGTVFKISPSGILTTVYNFCSQSNCTDGTVPNGLVQATNGDFYGTTEAGGAYIYGTVFKMTPSGNLTTLHSFDVTDGDTPGTLIQATDGNFYGATQGGGTNGDGTVFKITPDGTLTTLHSFDGTDGARPQGALVQATDGNFYGTTVGGGGARGFGTVFQITPSGRLTTLHHFDGTDGANPQAGLVQATDGNFYGTTKNGGTNVSGGTVFNITPSGTLTTLYSFCSQSGCTDGNNPKATLVQATDGNFYGTTYQGGTSTMCNLGCGTVFSITPSGTLTTLYSLCSQSGCTDGNNPIAGLVQGTDGIFYGTTFGGANGSCNGGCGTVFSLSVGLGPFVETLAPSGKVGAVVKILGTNLTGATSVTFNGAAATFTVVASSLIKTTVPAGATSGAVQVVTPSGTLSSNVPFRVRP